MIHRKDELTLSLFTPNTFCSTLKVFYTCNSFFSASSSSNTWFLSLGFIIGLKLLSVSSFQSLQEMGFYPENAEVPLTKATRIEILGDVEESAGHGPEQPDLIWSKPVLSSVSDKMVSVGSFQQKMKFQQNSISHKGQYQYTGQTPSFLVKGLGPKECSPMSEAWYLTFKFPFTLTYLWPPWQTCWTIQNLGTTSSANGSKDSPSFTNCHQ